MQLHALLTDLAAAVVAELLAADAWLYVCGAWSMVAAVLLAAAAVRRVDVSAD